MQVAPYLYRETTHVYVALKVLAALQRGDEFLVEVIAEAVAVHVLFEIAEQQVSLMRDTIGEMLVHVGHRGYTFGLHGRTSDKGTLLEANRRQSVSA
jgi:hypothetical protein